MTCTDAPVPGSNGTIERILKERYLTLATVCDTGRPWGTPVFYGVDSHLRFIFISAVDSVHAKNIRRTGNAAWTIILAGEEPDETDGLIFHDPELIAQFVHRRTSFVPLDDLLCLLLAQPLHAAWQRLFGWLGSRFSQARQLPQQPFKLPDLHLYVVVVARWVHRRRDTTFCSRARCVCELRRLDRPAVWGGFRVDGGGRDG